MVPNRLEFTPTRYNVSMGMKRKPKQRAGQSTRAPHTPPRSAREFFARPKQFQKTWNRVTHIISKMRADAVSLTQASREFGVDPRTVLRLGRSALRKRRNGRYAAKPKDTLLRVLAVPSPEGVREIAIRDSRQASRLGEYWAAVQKYLQTGNASAIEKFHGKRVTDASRRRIPLLTSLEDLDRLGLAGALSFESLYARVA